MDVQETAGKKHGTVERGVVEKKDANGAEGEKTGKVFHRREKNPQGFSTGGGEPVENAAERLAVEDVTAAAPLLLETRRMEEAQARVRLGGLAAEELDRLLRRDSRRYDGGFFLY